MIPSTPCITSSGSLITGTTAMQTGNISGRGSTNVSHAQFTGDRNNVIVIQDESLCATYTREFEEMWGSHTDLPDRLRAKFGSEKLNNVPHILNVAGTRMEVWFSPSDSVTPYMCILLSRTDKEPVFFACINLRSRTSKMHCIPYSMGGKQSVAFSTHPIRLMRVVRICG